MRSYIVKTKPVSIKYEKARTNASKPQGYMNSLVLLLLINTM